MNKIDFKDNNLFGHTQPPLENVPGITYLGQLKTKKSKEIKDSIVMAEMRKGSGAVRLGMA